MSTPLDGEHRSPTAPIGARAALVVLVALVVLSPWPFGSAHLRTTQAIAVVSLATALGAFLADGRGQKPPLPRALPWLLLGLWTLAVFQLIPLPETLHRWVAPGSAAVWHPDVPAAASVLGPGPHPVSLHPEATRRWLAFATGLAALALAALPALRERRYRLRATIAVVAGAFLVAVYGIVARLAFDTRLYGVFAVPTVAPFGPFVSKNHFAGYVEMAALLAVGLATGLADEARRGEGWLTWIDSRRAKWVVAAWGVAFVLVLAVPVSLSRGGVVSLSAGLAAFVLLRWWGHTSARLSPRGLGLVFASGAILAAGLTAVLPSEARDRVLTLAGVTSEQSGAYRLTIWRDTLRLAASSPLLGTGFGAYEDALPRFKTAAGNLRVEHAENDSLELLAEGGVPGALLGVLSAVVLFLWGLGRLKTDGHLLARALRAGVLAGVVGLSVHSLFDFNLHIPSNALLGIWTVAVAVMTVNATDAETETAGRAGALRWVLPAITGVGLVVALATSWSGPRWDSHSLTRAATPAGTDLRRTVLERDLVAHLRQRPADATAWVQLGWLHVSSSRKEGAALSAWGVSLDPRHGELASAARPLLEEGR